MVSDMDTTMMEVERVDRAGDRLMVTGIMMGNFPTEAFLEPDDLLTMIAMHLRPSPLGFLAGLPYFRLRSRWHRPENRSVGARMREVGLSVLLALAVLTGVTAMVVGLVQIARFAIGLF